MLNNQEKKSDEETKQNVKHINSDFIIDFDLYVQKKQSIFLFYFIVKYFCLNEYVYLEISVR
jgi:hypothetical protein